MEPIEINAGGYYLRQYRADDLLDDRPELVEVFRDRSHWPSPGTIDSAEQADRYITRRAGEWTSGQRASWVIAEPTTGVLLGEVGLAEIDPAGHAWVTVWVRPTARGRGAATSAVGAATRFGLGALDLTEISYRQPAGDVAAARVVQRNGFGHADVDQRAPAGPDAGWVSWVYPARNR